MVDNYETILLSESIENIGENEACERLSDFSCEYKKGECNEETEKFLKSNAINFSKQRLSITYLVVNQDGDLVGFFAITHKPINIELESLSSNTQKRKVEKYSTYDSKLKMYTTSAFLIAQLSKNYALPPNKQIDGKDLMNLVFLEIFDVQRLIGGGVIFLEYEDSIKLSHFYESPPNNFSRFGERYSLKDGKKYIQSMRVI